MKKKKVKKINKRMAAVIIAGIIIVFSLGTSMITGLISSGIITGEVKCRVTNEELQTAKEKLDSGDPGEGYTMKAMTVQDDIVVARNDSSGQMANTNKNTDANTTGGGAPNGTGDPNGAGTTTGSNTTSPAGSTTGSGTAAGTSGTTGNGTASSTTGNGTTGGTSGGTTTGSGAQASNNDYIFPNSDKERLKESDLSGISKEKLRIGRNEIMARHGRIFDSKDLKEYFESKSWYKGTVSGSEFDKSIKTRLNDVERANIEMIKKHE